MKKIMKKNLAERIYCNWLPIYIPSYSSKYKLAIWCCILFKYSDNLWKVLKGIRITFRNEYKPLIVMKRGEV